MQIVEARKNKQIIDTQRIRLKVWYKSLPKPTGKNKMNGKSNEGLDILDFFFFCYYYYYLNL